MVNQVYLLHRAASQRLRSLGLLILHNLSRMQALHRHKQTASLATHPSQHRQVVSLETPHPSRHRQAAFLGTPPLSRHRQAISLVMHPCQHSQVASLEQLPLSLREACSARTKIKLRATSNSNRVPVSSLAVKTIRRAEAFLGHSKIINRSQVDCLALQILSSLNRQISLAQ